MSNEIQKNFSNEDICVYVLGANGVTEKTPITSSKAHELLSDSTNKSIRSTQVMFYRAVDKELFVKVNESPPEYCFTKSGFERYRTMKFLETELKGANHSLRDLIEKFYWAAFHDCIRDNKPRLEIKYKDIEKWLGLEFAEALLKNPTVLRDMNKQLAEMDAPIDDDFRPAISIIDLGKPYTVSVEEARQSIRVGRIIEVEGRVMMQSETKPRYLTAAFKCQRCGHISYVDQEPGGVFFEPYSCQLDACQRKGPFKLSHIDSTSIDSQTIYIESAHGQVQLMVVLDNPLCAPPWERDAKFVKVVGELAVVPVTKNNRKEFDFVLNANSIKLAEDSTIEPPSDEEILMFDEWGKNPQELRQKLIDSVAPHIYGKHEEKDALSISLFSDWTWKLKAENTLDRSSLHILLIGDPGTAKSQLIRDVLKLAPIAIMGQGENATGAGLSNAAIQQNGVWQIRAGLFAKADGGVVGLDELDKLDENDLKTLQSILEYQKQIVDKAGMHIHFDTRCAAICGANPKKGHLNDYDPIIDQLGLASFLFQRFDLVFVIRDVPGKETDRMIYTRISETQNNSAIGDITLKRPIPADLYKKFVLYARSKPKPSLSEAAKGLIGDFYVNARGTSGKGNNDAQYPAISARSAAALIKLTTAIARRELSLEATVEHAQYAISLYTKSVISMGLGRDVDFSVFEHGGTRSQNERIKFIHEALLSMTKEEPVTAYDVMKNTGYPEVEVKHTLKHLTEKGKIIETKPGFYRAIV